ncbi:MAG: 2OG-Fe(II) oxygenase [Trichodesmium sp.]
MNQCTIGTEKYHQSCRLQWDNLQALCEGKISLLRIPEFYPKNLCEYYAQKVIEDDRLSSYRHLGAEKIYRTGLSYFETYENPELHQQYYQQALANIRKSRNLFSPHLNPIDKLRLELEEVSPSGANLENIEGKTMNVGLSRVIRNNTEILPHLDVLEWDAPNCARAGELKTQLAANIFLQTSQGGKLEVWCRKLSKEDYYLLAVPGSYGVDRQFLGTPDVTIKPEVGDLILFDSTHVHAVTLVTTGARVSISCFIGYRSPSQPLSYWS